MTITFNHVPNTLRTPFMAVEIDNSKARRGPSALTYRGLIVGQKTAAGTGTANTFYKVTSADEVATYGGRGSMLHRQALAYFDAKPGIETWILVLADDAGGVAASGKIVFAGTATAAGTVSFYAGAERVTVGVEIGDDAATVAAALAAEFPSSSDYPVTAAVDGSVDEEVDFTFRHKGLVGNEYDLRLNVEDGEALPAGITATITAMASGTTNPSLTTAIAAWGDRWFHFVTMPYTDATSLTSMENALAERFQPPLQIDGHCFTWKAASHGTLTTLGESRNSPHVSICSSPGDNGITPPMEAAANLCGIVAKYAPQDVSLPLHTLPLPWVHAPAEADLYTLEERDLLLHSGIATTVVADGGVVQIEGLITTYQTNGVGADDDSYLYVTTKLTLQYARYAFNTKIRTKYARAKLAADGTKANSGQKVLTPKQGKAEALEWYDQMVQLGHFEEAGLALFKTELVVERDISNPNRMNWLLPPDLINQFIVGAANLQFIL